MKQQILDKWLAFQAMGQKQIFINQNARAAATNWANFQMGQGSDNSAPLGNSCVCSKCGMGYSVPSSIYHDSGIHAV